MQARPQIDSPRGGPTGGFIAAFLQRIFRRRRKFWRVKCVDLPAWIQTVEMRDVAMMDINAGRVVPVLEPFLKLSLRTDLQRREPVWRGGDFLLKVGVHTEDLRRFDDVGKQAAQNFQIHRGSGADG